MDGSKILIFAETKRGADNLTRDLRGDGWPALSIHGDKKQEERIWVLEEFRNGKSPIMVATDVASRGLDVKDIRYVINFDFPNQIEDYIHRIGRTGRAGAQGSAYTFFSPEKFKLAKELVKVLDEAGQEVCPELRQLVQSEMTIPRRGPPSSSLKGGHPTNHTVFPHYSRRDDHFSPPSMQSMLINYSIFFLVSFYKSFLNSVFFKVNMDINVVKLLFILLNNRRLFPMSILRELSKNYF
jgi:hypothetical protein